MINIIYEITVEVTWNLTVVCSFVHGRVRDLFYKTTICLFWVRLGVLRKSYAISISETNKRLPIELV